MCIPCGYKRHIILNAKSNPLRKLHYELAGTAEQYYRMSDAGRAQIRATVRARLGDALDLPVSPIASAMAGPVNPTRDRIVINDGMGCGPQETRVVTPVDLVTKMAWKIAGNERKYNLLTATVQNQLRQTAATLREAGRSAGAAEAYEVDHLDGFVYVMTNPAWPEAVKVGRANDSDERENNYQTGSPYRDYVMRYDMYFEDCRVAEKAIHADLETHQLEGEWFEVSITDAVWAIQMYELSLHPDQLENFLS